jgi:thymidine phosphorylase
MKTQKDAEELASSLINTAKSFNKKVIAFITDMNQPLGYYIGNWLEVYESIKVLQNEFKESDLTILSTTLSGAMIYLGKKASSINEGIEISKELIKSGKAFDKFIEIVKLQGGDIKLIENPEKYPKAKFIEKITAKKDGYLKETDNYRIGIAGLELGAGRKTKEDKIDPKAGIIINFKIGDFVKKGSIIAELHSSSANKMNFVKNWFPEVFTFSKEPIKKMKLIKKTIS